MLAGIATRTQRITLGSAVTVLSSDDPVRVFERFATLDALSQGRAEITAGRGSFTESFPLFGYSLADYDVLFVEKLELLVALLEEGAVTWSGSTRTPLADQQVYPKTERGRIPMRVGVGGTPESVVRAARLDLPMALAIIGGDPARFTPIANLYRHALSEFGRDPLPLSIHSPGHIADTDEQATAELWPNYRDMFGRIGRERGWPAPTYERFLDEVQQGSLYVGSPEYRREEDGARHPRPGRPALRPQVLQRRAGAQQAHALHRALCHGGGPPGPAPAGRVGRPVHPRGRVTLPRQRPAAYRRSMEWESIVNWLYALSIIVLPIIAFAGVGAWLDRRSSSTPEDVEQDIEQYGAAAGGIRSRAAPRGRTTGGPQGTSGGSGSPRSMGLARPPLRPRR